jgi:hypothetical protein
MKTSSRILAVTAAATLLARAGVAAPLEGDREGNGGSGIDVSGRPWLRDLTNSACRWKSGTAMTAGRAEYERILATLARVQPLYRQFMEYEATRVNVCLTDDDLIHVPAEDQDAVTIFESNQQQLAVRVGTEIYIDGKLFARLDARNQAYLLFHEFMHSFIPLSTPRRYAKLRGFVRLVNDLENTMEIDRAEFYFQINSNGVQWPTTGFSESGADFAQTKADQLRGEELLRQEKIFMNTASSAEARAAAARALMEISREGLPKGEQCSPWSSFVSSVLGRVGGPLHAWFLENSGSRSFEDYWSDVCSSDTASQLWDKPTGSQQLSADRLIRRYYWYEPKTSVPAVSAKRGLRGLFQ